MNDTELKIKHVYGEDIPEESRQSGVLHNSKDFLDIRCINHIAKTKEESKKSFENDKKLVALY